METEGSHRYVMKDQMETGTEDHLETTLSVMITGCDRLILLCGYKGKGCHHPRGQEVEGASETSAHPQGVALEVEQAGNEEGGSCRVPTEKDKGRTFIRKRGACLQKGTEEKWMTPITLGNFKQNDLTRFCRGATKSQDPIFFPSSLQNFTLAFILLRHPTVTNTACVCKYSQYLTIIACSLYFILAICNNHCLVHSVTLMIGKYCLC